MHCDREQEREAWEAAVQGLAKKAKARQVTGSPRSPGRPSFDCLIPRRPSLDARKGSVSIKHSRFALASLRKTKCAKSEALS